MSETTVKLSCEALKVKDREYAITHAQALLDKEKEMGVENWQLTDNKFMLKDGIIQRANNKPDKGTKGEGSADKGSQA
jgi:hypothetical protein